jgi:hypothetical protein
MLGKSADMVVDQDTVLEKFNDLLIQCYQGKLVEFCEDFDIKKRGESFYKKVQKSRNRMIKQNVRNETIDEFKKFNLFMESKLLEKQCSKEEKKALNEFKSFVGLGF